MLECFRTCLSSTRSRYRATTCRRRGPMPCWSSRSPSLTDSSTLEQVRTLMYGQPICRSNWNEVWFDKRQNLCNIKLHNLIWADLKTLLFVYHWLRHMARTGHHFKHYVDTVKETWKDFKGPVLQMLKL